jgi:lipopolysaccharide export system protein LptC
VIQRLLGMAPIAALALLAAVSVWLERTANTEPEKRQVARHDPDFWAENITIRKYGPEGQLQNTLTAEKMLHFPDNDTTLLTKPQLRYHRDEPVVISGTQGVVSQRGEEVSIIGGATVQREGRNQALPTRVETEVLTLLPDEGIARSQHPVVITQGQTVLRGSGMDANNKEGVSVLFGRVTGEIHRKQPQ